MNEITIDVSFENGTCYVTGINLVTGDYNSTKCKFTFDKEDGVKIFKMKNPNDETIFEQEIIDNELILTGYDENDQPASLFNNEGDYLFEIKLYSNDGRLTSAKNVLSVEEELVKEDDSEIVVYKPLFDQIMSQLNDAINEVETLDISVDKVGKVTTIEVTKKDGTSQSVEVNDGEKGATGANGQDAKINGVNTINIVAGDNITLEQENNTLTINSSASGGSSNYEELSNLPKINNVELKGNKTSTDLGLQPAGNYATMSDIPDVSNFITKSVDDLVNYYLKSETYTKTEVNNLIGAINQFHYEIVQELPTTGESNILYLTPKTTSQTNNAYDEYVYANNNWEKIGDTQIDLSNYVTTSMLNSALSNYTTTTDLNTLLSGKQATLVSGTNIKTINNESVLGSGNIQITSAPDIDNSTITLNSSNKLQTTGIIDNNNGNTDKLWTGTLAQYNAIQEKDANTFYYITDDDATSTLREKVEVITSNATSYTISNLTANKSYKLGELTTLTITTCETFDEESVIYFSSGNTATVLSLPNDVIQIGDTTIELNKSYIISILNKIAVIKAYEVS